MPVHGRHDQIKQDETRLRLGLRHLQGVRTGRGEGDPILCAQYFGHRRDVVRDIIDDQNGLTFNIVHDSPNPGPASSIITRFNNSRASP